jgi:hypothetical protein
MERHLHISKRREERGEKKSASRWRVEEKRKKEDGNLAEEYWALRREGGISHLQLSPSSR